MSYPRRVTLDLDDDRYEWLKETAWQLRIPGGIAGLLRAAIDLLASDEALVERAERRRPEDHDPLNECSPSSPPKVSEGPGGTDIEGGRA